MQKCENTCSTQLVESLQVLSRVKYAKQTSEKPIKNAFILFSGLSACFRQESK